MLQDANLTNEMQIIINRYEKIKQKKKITYFDIHEFEEIISHYIENNNLKSGYEVLKIATRQHPDSLILQQKEAQLLIESGYFIKAIQILKQIISLEPSNFEVILLVGVAYGKLGNIKNSLKYFEQALTEFVDDENRIFILYNISLTYINIGRYDIAAKFLKKAYFIDKYDFEVIFDLAFCLERIDEIEESCQLYERYVTSDPFSKLAWYNLGVVYNKLNLYKKSIQAYDYSIALDEKFASPLLNKADVLYTLGKYQESIDIFVELIKLEPHNDIAHYVVGKCYEQFSDYKNAIQYYKMALQINNKNADALYSISSILHQKGQYKKSKSFIKKAIQINNQDSRFWFLLAQIYYKLKKIQNSDKAYLRAIDIEPFKEEFWLDYSDKKYQQNDFHKAINILNEAKEYSNGNPLINLRLAASYFSDGNNNLAFRFLGKALKQDNNSYKDFLNYYPQAKVNTKICKFINNFIKKNV